MDFYGVSHNEFYTDPELPGCSIVGLDFNGVFNRYCRESLLRFDSSTGQYSVPNKINNICVTAIDYQAFAECRSLNSVSIPLTVTHIGLSIIGINTLHFILTLTQTSYDYRSRRVQTKMLQLKRPVYKVLREFPIWAIPTRIESSMFG